MKIFAITLLSTICIASLTFGTEDKDINLLEVPDVVIEAVQERLNEFILLEAELGYIGNRQAYKLIGISKEKIYEIKMDVEGYIIEIEEKHEIEDLSLYGIPKEVIESAKNAVEVIILFEASVEREYGKLVYELQGKTEKKCYEIEVSSTGKVLEIEKCD